MYDGLPYIVPPGSSTVQPWRRAVTVGETLANARRSAGLSLSQVTDRTRIREAIIADIERDDYSSCGGDFYARGHIRSIAKAVHTDPVPLIEEYDDVHDYHPPTFVTDLLHAPDEPGSGGSGPGSAERGPDLTDRGPVVSSRPAAGPQVPGRRPEEGRRPADAGHGLLRMGRRPGEGYRPSDAGTRQFGDGHGRSDEETRPDLQRRQLGEWHRQLDQRRRRRKQVWAAAAVVGALALVGFLVSSLFGGSKNVPVAGGTTHHHPRPSSSRPSTSASHSPAPPASAAAPSQTLTPVHVVAFGQSGGGQGDNPQLASLATSGKPGNSWHTDWYNTPRFGNLYSGTGLLLDMGHRVTVGSTRVWLASGPGAGLEMRVGSVPTLAGLAPVARATSTGAQVRLTATHPVTGRYVLLWFTRLPADSSGTYQASVYGITVKGMP